MKRVAAYCRISTSTQDTSSQLLAIKEAIQSNGDTLISVYEDIGISGVKSRTDRPALDQMLRDAREGKFDKVIQPINEELSNSADTSNTSNDNEILKIILGIKK